MGSSMLRAAFPQRVFASPISLTAVSSLRHASASFRKPSLTLHRAGVRLAHTNGIPRQCRSRELHGHLRRGTDNSPFLTFSTRPGALQIRSLSFSKVLHSEPHKPAPPANGTPPSPQPDEPVEEIHQAFERSEKATQAAQINLSARLAKEGLAHGKRAGIGEVSRLIRIAKPEAKLLSAAFAFLIVSSTVTMSIPFSIGKILDIATNSNPNALMEAFGLALPWFYTTLGGVLVVGAAANYGRIIILRIVGERIVARLRSNLYRRTFIQDAEFFDANRVGDLISRLSSDTIIVGKSITQNLSDGLRAGVSGVAGFGMMAFVSLKLSSILALLFPPVALGAFFYGRAIRNLSRKIQKNLGGLTKIAEERLGNVRTSQSFAGELQEVSRYNKQVRKIFELGKKESFISATFFSTVSSVSFPVLMINASHN